MFYDMYSNLCRKIGKSPTGVALELNISRGTVSAWKNKGTTPQRDILQKIADYFGVTVDYLLGNETSYEAKKSPDQMSEDEEIAQMVEELKNNPGKRLLFSKTSKATKEDIEKIIKMVDILTGGDESGGSYY